MINAGIYRHKIIICKVDRTKDSDGFPIETESAVLITYAKIKTTKGFTLIQNDSDFEKALTNFTIRYPKTGITRDMLVKYNNKTYTIEYLNNVDEQNVELEMQCKLVKK